MLRYEDWEFHPDRLPSNHLEKEKALDALEVRFREELTTDTRVQEYLAGYDPEWAEKFLRDYAAAKRRAVEYGWLHIREADTPRELRYREETEEAFEAILQKKLFNMQLLWRAEQLQLPGIRTGQDFYYWEQNIRECPFLEPVTEAEISSMRQFLKTDHAEIDGWTQWQDYDELMEQDEEGHFEMMPDWYEFYDSRHGTGALLLLPNIRGEKDDHYHLLGARQQQEAFKARQAANPPAPSKKPLPAIHCGFEEQVKIAGVVDDEIFQKIFRQQLHEQQERDAAQKASGVHDLDVIMMNLEQIKDPPPVRGGLNLREALRQCWTDYLHASIAEDLDLVWQEYELMKETGLANTDPTVEGKDEVCNLVAGMILDGRELSGEPRDFDY